MQTLTQESPAVERIRLFKTEPESVSKEGLDDHDFKLVVILGLFGLPLPGPMDFYRHSRIMTQARRWDFLRPGLHRSTEPWRDIYKKMSESEYASLAWTARPRALPPSGENTSPTECAWRDRDALAAYVHALIGYFAGDRAHAALALGILDTWARVSTGQTGFQRCHESDWAVLAMSGAAEILRRVDGDLAATGLRIFVPALKRACLQR